MSNLPRSRDFSRRDLLKVGTGILGTGALTAWVSRQEQSVAAPPAIANDPSPANNDLTPEQALQRLMEGHQRFLTDTATIHIEGASQLRNVVHEQNPFAAILACSDSRVAPEILFDQGLGNLFVVRTAGNISSTEDIASLEFATLILGAKVIVVMGHTGCGAVKAAIKGGEVPGLISSLILAIRPAINRVKDQPGDLLENSIKANAINQVERLRISGVLSNLKKNGQLLIVPAYFDLETGKVSLLS
ncbi:carbonate dehydratase [Neosynechococcus sphagnicola sy1]|uniref:carbonic anhydrase n=1 Tax=Neosynechococcus sphagnicola sy1 TaxID=1497020 RepID=A0A098TMB2_9CYAN|nr:carbonic anhydrase [Neosynechococcus sphagnicola]KGF71978.1 carbonate dehydratase [Neosynechococcus sphagnicola sy1]